MGSEANRIANARVTGLKNARLSKINKFKGCVKQKQLAKFAEEPKQPTLSVTNEELHANHVFVLQIIEPELATTLVVAELERAKALGRGAVAKIRDHPSRLDNTVGASLQLNQRLQNQSKRYTQDLLPDSGVNDAVLTAVQPLLECARSPLSVAPTRLITHQGLYWLHNSLTPLCWLHAARLQATRRHDRPRYPHRLQGVPTARFATNVPQGLQPGEGHLASRRTDRETGEVHIPMDFAGNAERSGPRLCILGQWSTGEAARAAWVRCPVQGRCAACGRGVPKGAHARPLVSDPGHVGPRPDGGRLAIQQGRRSGPVRRGPNRGMGRDLLTARAPQRGGGRGTAHHDRGGTGSQPVPQVLKAREGE